MQRFLLTALVATLALVSAAGALAAPVFFVDGRGWGHGIGMAQYGAQGFATRDGRPYTWILSHYYRGTTLGQTPVTLVRVLLADDRSTLSVGSDTAFSVTDANDQTYELPAGALKLGPSLEITVDGERKRLASPARFTRGTKPLELGGRAYRGELVVRASGGTLSAVNHVGLEEYLYGVVPDEMPPSWHMEALKAQAVAARSYAVVSRRTSGVFDLYSDTRSQVYGGIPSEETRTNGAINATAGRVVLHNGRVAHTFFHSTSGGRTAAIQDVWNAAPVPYLVAVPDPHDDLSPYHRWGPFRFTASGLAAKLGSLAPAGSLADAVVARNGSGRADSVTLRGSRGTTRVGGTTFQSRLGLRSSWFSVSVLSLGGPARTTFGSAVALRGVARGPKVAFLERRVGSGHWERVGRIERSSDGTFRISVEPARTTSYRVSATVGKSIERRVAVAPLVRFGRVTSQTELPGFIRPAVAGATITVQRLEGTRWRTVATTRTTARGRFRAAVTLSPGTYRALANLGAGYVPGRSPTLKVVAE
jgi:stage II sporulation protein D